MKITIRRARILHVPSIEKIGYCTKELGVSKKIKFYYTKELNGWINNPEDNIFLVALVGGKVVGFLFSKIISDSWAMLDNIAHLRNLEIKELAGNY